MTLSWDVTDERVVIEVFPFTEAAVVSPEQLEEDLEDLLEPEPDEILLVRLPAAARVVRRAGPHRDRCRSARLPLLRRAGRPGRPPVRARQRLPPP